MPILLYGLVSSQPAELLPTVVLVDRVALGHLRGELRQAVAQRAQLPALEAAGLVVADAQCLRATAAGLQRLNAIIAAIAA